MLKEDVLNYIKKMNGWELYSCSFVCSDTKNETDCGLLIEGIPISEIIAQYVLNKNIKLEYKSELKDNFETDHIGKYGDSITNEKSLCRSWFNTKFPKELESLGFAIDYETNLRPNVKTNIDITSFNPKLKKMYLIEAKGNGKICDGYTYYSSKESLLRAILEIETYYETLKNNNLINNYIRSISPNKNCWCIKEFNKYRNELDISSIELCIVAPKGSYLEVMYNDKEKYHYTNELLKKYNIKFITFEEKQPIIKGEVLCPTSQEN